MTKQILMFIVIKQCHKNNERREVNALRSKIRILMLGIVQ